MKTRARPEGMRPCRTCRANMLKNNATLEEMEKIVVDLRTIQNQYKPQVIG